ncbi:molybdate ABC transporter permease subunit [Pseudoalteromonas prydzensis]|jgi:molybdate transport system permease protein|uniref:molybdate ABC transporter permease subunit n=1 Tax=Pseudoalteromonas prydzensis TaxID=182141 RepID=UPI002148BBFA|nr:molybdate ABC transporter permease subunit [Pseudoalteromonas prydzensis]
MSFGSTELMAFWITFKLALLTSSILMVLCIPLAWWLNNSRSLVSRLIESLVTLPIVLPPTVLGFYLLMAFAPTTILGHQFEVLTGQQLAFSFSGILLGSLFYSLPFAMQPLQTAFAQFDNKVLDAAHSLGASPAQAFFQVTLPLCKHGIISAALLCFAHTVGEFGVILMIGGNIPGETQVLSVAIFDAVETMDYAKAYNLSAALLIFAVITLVMINILKRKEQDYAKC